MRVYELAIWRSSHDPMRKQSVSDRWLALLDAAHHVKPRIHADLNLQRPNDLILMRLLREVVQNILTKLPQTLPGNNGNLNRRLLIIDHILQPKHRNGIRLPIKQSTCTKLKIDRACVAGVHRKSNLVEFPAQATRRRIKGRLGNMIGGVGGGDNDVGSLGEPASLGFVMKVEGERFADFDSSGIPSESRSGELEFDAPEQNGNIRPTAIEDSLLVMLVKRSAIGSHTRSQRLLGSNRDE